MSDENVDVNPEEVPAVDETTDEDKPVGPATVIGDEPVEQFPAAE